MLGYRKRERRKQKQINKLGVISLQKHFHGFKA